MEVSGIGWQSSHFEPGRGVYEYSQDKQDLKCHLENQFSHDGNSKSRVEKNLLQSPNSFRLMNCQLACKKFWEIYAK